MAKIKIWGEYIVVKDGNSFSVYQSFKDAKPELVKICNQYGLPCTNVSNTRQLGKMVFDAPIGTVGSNEKTIDDYVVMRDVNGTYSVYRKFPKGSVKGALRDIANAFGIPYDPNYTTNQIGGLLL